TSQSVRRPRFLRIAVDGSREHESGAAHTRARNSAALRNGPDFLVVWSVRAVLLSSPAVRLASAAPWVDHHRASLPLPHPMAWRGEDGSAGAPKTEPSFFLRAYVRNSAAALARCSTASIRLDSALARRLVAAC